MNDEFFLTERYAHRKEERVTRHEELQHALYEFMEALKSGELLSAEIWGTGKYYLQFDRNGTKEPSTTFLLTPEDLALICQSLELVEMLRIYQQDSKEYSALIRAIKSALSTKNRQKQEMWAFCLASCLATGGSWTLAKAETNK